MAVLVFCMDEGMAVASSSVLAFSFLSVVVKTQQGMFGVAGHCCSQCCPHCQMVPVVAHTVLTTLPNSSQGWLKVLCGPHAVPSIVCMWLLCVGVWELDSMDGDCPVLVSLKASITNYIECAATTRTGGFVVCLVFF